MGITENKPPAHPGTGLSGPARFLITAAAFVVVIAGMRAAADIIVPFLMSIFLAIISAPALFWLKSKGISTIFAILLVSGAILLVGLLVGALLTASIADFTQDLPAYTNKLNDEVVKIEQKLKFWMEKIRSNFHRFEKTPPEMENETTVTAEGSNSTKTEPSGSLPTPSFSLTQFLDARAIIRLVGDMLAQFGSILANGALIYLTTIFILLEASILPAKIKTAMQANPEAFDNLTSIAGNVKKYLAIKTGISLLTGTLITIWLLILGVKYAFVWGLVAFLLNFVPSIGSFIAAVPACILALVQLGLGSAVLAALGYIVANVVVETLLQPRLMGQQMGLSTLVVFASLVFWGWVLGPVGMLLSVPLTMALKIVLESHPDTRVFAILLGSHESPKQPKKAKKH
jgi:predicted PurR-regulated permease PerM